MEAQREFMVLVEDAIRQPDLSKSVQRYQLAVDQAKVRLNMVVCPGAWLMPGDMEINTESTVGYNNQLKQATQGMKLGINNSVNKDTKKAALRPTDGGPSKVNPPKSHPSNPIHKAATAESAKKPEPSALVEVTDSKPEATTASGHDINKIALTVGAVGVRFGLVTTPLKGVNAAFFM